MKWPKEVVSGNLIKKVIDEQINYYRSKKKANGAMAMVAKTWRYVTRTRGFIPDSMANFDVMFMPA